MMRCGIFSMHWATASRGSVSGSGDSCLTHIVLRTTERLTSVNEMTNKRARCTDPSILCLSDTVVNPTMRGLREGSWLARFLVDDISASSRIPCQHKIFSAWSDSAHLVMTPTTCSLTQRWLVTVTPRILIVVTLLRSGHSGEGAKRLAGKNVSEMTHLVSGWT